MQLFRSVLVLLKDQEDKFLWGFVISIDIFLSFLYLLIDMSEWRHVDEYFVSLIGHTHKESIRSRLAFFLIHSEHEAWEIEKLYRFLIACSVSLLENWIFHLGRTSASLNTNDIWIFWMIWQDQETWYVETGFMKASVLVSVFWPAPSCVFGPWGGQQERQAELRWPFTPPHPKPCPPSLPPPWSVRGTESAEKKRRERVHSVLRVCVCDALWFGAEGWQATGAQELGKQHAFVRVAVEHISD